MNGNRTNFFVVNTPFQMMVVQTLVKEFFYNDKNYIVSTIPEVSNLAISNLKMVFIRRNLLSLIDLVSFKIKLNYSIKKSSKTSFFVPHLNNLLSSYLYKRVIKNSNCSMNCYYEGIALFYDPEVHLSSATLLKRRVMSILSGHIYKHHSKLFPVSFRKISTAYSPILKYTTGFLETIQFNFENGNLSTNQSKDIVILGSPLKTISSLKHQKSLMDNLFESAPKIAQAKYFFKPHYESEKDLVVQLLKEIPNMIVLDKNIPVEKLIIKKNIAYIVAIHPSSALINLKLMFRDSVSVSVLSWHNLANELVVLFKGLGVEEFRQIVRKN
ncbi:MAG: polysialyltransferase family glycosyltransferase [Crocinitomicaceae bacterium]|nr:polysialyltransferase family glycosyltransferase [Crocinitomicaceae bacterium]